MLPPWVTEEIQAHPYRMWLIHAIALLVFTLILISRMPAYEYITYKYPAKSPGVTSPKSSKSVKNRQEGVSKRVMRQLSEAPRRPKVNPLPTRPAPSPSPTGTSSGPSGPSPRPSVRPPSPPATSPGPVDLPSSPPITQPPITPIPITTVQ